MAEKPSYAELERKIRDLERDVAARWESEPFIKTVMDHLPIGISVNAVDPAVTFQYMNDNFVRCYRTTRAALADPDAFWEAVYEDAALRERIKNRVLADCASGDPANMIWKDVPITRRDGETTFVDAQNIPVPGTPLMISTVLDVTERRQAMIDLQRSEARFRDLFRNMYDGVAIYRAEAAAADFVFVDMNRAGERISAVDREAIVGRRLTHVFPGVKEMGLFAVLQRVARTGVTEHFPSTQYRDGRLSIWVDNVVFKLPSGEVVAVYRDDTERQQAVEDLRKSEATVRELNRSLEKRVAQRTAQLERSNQELESFAYIASHDLQEPLRKVQAFSDRLKTKYAGVLDAQGLDYLNRLASAGSRMQRMVNDLLTFSRVNTRGETFVAVDLNETVETVLADLEIRISETHARIEISELPSIDADPRQMQQLFANLISNAVKFHAESVEPVVRIYQARRTAKDTDASCRIIVQDNGIGFDEQYLDRIFKPFQRLHGRDAYAGTGIGLAICQRIVQRHNGSITAESRLGRGTRFVVSLPMQQPCEE